MTEWDWTESGAYILLWQNKLKIPEDSQYRALGGRCTSSSVLRWNIQLWAWPVTAEVLKSLSRHHQWDDVETVRCWRPARNNSTDGLARSENSSEFQSTMVRSKECTYSSRFEEWMSVGRMTWFDESRYMVDQLELETGCWRLRRMLLSDYFFGELTEVTTQADWEDR